MKKKNEIDRYPDLVIRYGGLGDVIMTLGFLNALSRKKKVYFVTHRNHQELLDRLDLPNVKWIYIRNNINSLSKKDGLILGVLETFFHLFLKRFNKVYIPYYDKRYRYLLVFSSYNKIQDLNDIEVRKDTYFGDLLMNFVKSEPFLFPNISLPKISKKKIILCPGGNPKIEKGKFLRMWPTENYKKLISLLLIYNFEFILVGTKKDRLEEIFPEYKKHIFSSDSLGEVAFQVKSGFCLVSGDSGMMHLSLLLDVNLIAIFGPTSSEERLPHRLPFNKKIEILEQRQGLSCSPCYDGKNYTCCDNPVCMQQVKPELVFKKIQEYENSYRS